MKTTLFSSLLSYGSVALLAFAPVAQAGVDAWHLDYTWPLVRESLDPIVSPNAVASHMHRVIGKQCRVTFCYIIRLTSLDLSSRWFQLWSLLQP
jgi:hypothetical protein